MSKQTSYLAESKVVIHFDKPFLVILSLKPFLERRIFIKECCGKFVCPNSTSVTNASVLVNICLSAYRIRSNYLFSAISRTGEKIVGTSYSYNIEEKSFHDKQSY